MGKKSVVAYVTVWWIGEGGCMHSRLAGTTLSHLAFPRVNDHGRYPDGTRKLFKKNKRSRIMHVYAQINMHVLSEEIER